MRQRRSVVLAVVLAVCVAGQALGAPEGVGTAAAAPTSFDDARTLAKQRGAPVLLEFYTEW